MSGWEQGDARQAGVLSCSLLPIYQSIGETRGFFFLISREVGRDVVWRPEGEERVSFLS